MENVEIKKQIQELLDKGVIVLRNKHQYSIEKPQEKYSTP